MGHNEIDFMPPEKLDEFAAFAHQSKATPGVRILAEGELPEELWDAPHGENPELNEEGAIR